MSIFGKQLDSIADEAYDLGFVHGLRTFAHWKDGVEYVGTGGVTLKQAIEKRREFFNYELPPKLP